jgi:uncharacterized protein (TIRG00374 family)
VSDARPPEPESPGGTTPDATTPDAPTPPDATTSADTAAPPRQPTELEAEVAREVAEAEDEISSDQLSLTHRLRQPRTILSIVVPIILVLFMLRVFADIDLEQMLASVRAANPVLLLAAFVVFYIGFPLRGLRWTMLLRGTGFHLGVRDGTEIIFLSWLVNCLVPAKLGDVYRAYLLKINATVSLSRTFGTVFIERVLDLFAISVLGLAAGFWSFRSGRGPVVQVVFAFGVAVVVILAAGLLTMRNFGRRIIVALPLPHRVIELYDRFEEGVFGAIGPRGLIPLMLLTGLIWMTEAARLGFVVAALDLPGVSLGISGVVFVALIASLLTAVPLSPAGLGIVEGGMFFVLTAAYGIDPTSAATITLVDRIISYFSIIVFGSIAYVISPKRRGAGVRSAPVAS